MPVTDNRYLASGIWYPNVLPYSIFFVFPPFTSLLLRYSSLFTVHSLLNCSDS